MCAQSLPAKAARSEGQTQVELSSEALLAACREHPLLRPLLVVGAGFTQGLSYRPTRGPAALQHATIIFCVKGTGWWEAHGRFDLIRKGDLLVLPPGATHACGPQASSPWTVHWVHVTGERLADFLRELALGPQTPVLRIGEEPQLLRLFGEILRALQRGVAFANLLQASQALGYLLACLIHKRQADVPESSDTVQKVAQAIIYMSEHIQESLRVSDLARLAGLSSAHFGELFKDQTGSSPRDYLHLLRIHQACRLLQDSSLSIKEISARIGYRNPFHFSRQFKAFEGLSPSDYRAAKAGHPPQEPSAGQP